MESRCFDVYMMVDWSSASAPTRGADSIWIAELAAEPTRAKPIVRNCPTRYVAYQYLIERLASAVEAGQRVLLGFDFSLGYPAGLIKALRLGSWLELLEMFGHEVRDDDRNRSNRDQFASKVNSLLSDDASNGTPGPFWGCHANATTDWLKSKRVGSFEFPYRGLKEYRLSERNASQQGFRPQSVWKLNQGVAVGGQTILGLHYVSKLRFDCPQRAEQLRVWPFETGWQTDTGPIDAKHQISNSQIIVTEIFPSLLGFDTRTKDQLDSGEMCRDEAQVTMCVRHARQLDRAGRLRSCFERPEGLSDSEATVAEREEGWILWV